MKFFSSFFILALAFVYTGTLSAQALAISNPTDEVIPFKEAYALNLKKVKAEIGYPRVCQNAHLEGTVRVLVLSDAEGNYLEHKIQYATNRFFRKAVEKHLTQLKFSPAIQNSRQIGTWIPLEFKFHLHEE